MGPISTAGFGWRYCDLPRDFYDDGREHAHADRDKHANADRHHPIQRRSGSRC